MKKSKEELDLMIVLLKVHEAGKKVKKFNELKNYIIKGFGISEEALDEEIENSSPALSDSYVMGKLLGYINRIASDKDHMLKHLHDCLGVYDEFYGTEKQDNIRLFLGTCEIISNFIKQKTKPEFEFSVN